MARALRGRWSPSSAKIATVLFTELARRLGNRIKSSICCAIIGMILFAFASARLDSARRRLDAESKEKRRSVSIRFQISIERRRRATEAASEEFHNTI